MSMPLTAADLHGISPALPTPVKDDDTIDRPAVQVLIDHVVKGGVRCVVPLGGTGEFPSLSHEQRVRMVGACVEASAGRAPVIPGVLHPGYHDSMAACRAFAGAGADAVLLLTPYYTTPTQQGIRDYFMRAADASPLPVVLYEIPYRTRVAIQPQVIHELSRHGNVIGMKACNTDLHHFLKVAAGIADDFSLLSGEDVLFPAHLAAGAKGGIIVTSSVLPRTWVAMHQAGREARHADAVAMHRKLLPFLDMAFAEVNPGPLKSVWDLSGAHAPHVLAPLVPAADDLRRELRTELAARLEDEARLA